MGFADPQQVQFELHTGNGRADYLLKDSLGRVLCVLEAKREDLDPYDAKEQARGYAENLKAPFVILSNGREHWFWNYERADQRDAYRIERLPSREDLERVRLKNLQPPRPLESEIITPEYLRHLKPDLTLRRYQIRAMDEIARLFDTKGLRKFLLEMATGTGKTLLCAALIRRFLVTPQRRARPVHRGPYRACQADDGGLHRRSCRSSSRSSTRPPAARANCSAPRSSSRPSSR